uniref:TIR domain-containing protein n=1 Tax=Podarcis muralis TaxID=64176 RepID=A0A670JEN1_PODMU
MHAVFKVESLQELHIKDNDLQNFSTKQIISVPEQLRELDASHNPISLIDVTTSVLQSLSSLDLSFSIPNISIVWLIQDPCFLKGLKTLFLGGIAMKPPAISEVLQMINCTWLEAIHLNQLHLTETDGLIEQVCLRHGNVETLNLQHNSFTSVNEGAFENCTHLRSLNMAFNKLKVLPMTLFLSLHSLKLLSLANNKFTMVPNATSNMPSLECLDLSFNKIYRILPGDFAHLNNLKSLYATGNRISHVHSDIFGNLHSLQELNLEINLLTEINEPFPGSLKNLETLILRQNKLDSIKKDVFKNLTSLLVLNLADNQITAIEPGAFEGLSNLQSLVLGSNKITKDTFQEGLFQGLSSLVDLDLFNNYISYKSSKMLANPPFKLLKVLHFYQYICASPSTQKGQKLWTFETSSCIIDYGFILYITNTSAAILLMLVCFIYQWRLHMIYSYHLLLAYFIDKREKRKERVMGYAYDAFLSYNTHNEEWVINDLLPVLENQYHWKLCLHHRDFEPGRSILENIVDNIYMSRKTICIISRHYLESEWCSKEIQVASFRLFDENKDVLILIFLEDIPSEYLSPYHRMRKLIKKKTYLKWPQDEKEVALFWQNGITNR